MCTKPEYLLTAQILAHVTFTAQSLHKIYSRLTFLWTFLGQEVAWQRREVHSNFVQNVDTQSWPPKFLFTVISTSTKFTTWSAAWVTVSVVEISGSCRSWTTEKLHLTAENGAFIYLCTLNGPIHWHLTWLWLSPCWSPTVSERPCFLCAQIQTNEN